jgi:hypothetical protein
MEPINNFQEGSMIYSNGILTVEYRPETLIDETLLLKQIIYRTSITRNDPFFMIVDLRNVSEVTNEAIEIMAAHPSPQNIKAVAMITNTGKDHTRAKLYSMFDRPNVLTRAFLNSEDARSWFGTLENEGYNMKKAG